MENFKMEMMFLIVKLAYASVTIPEKYPAEQCKSVAAEINNSRYEAICIPAPRIKDQSQFPIPAVKEYPQGYGK